MLHEKLDCYQRSIKLAEALSKESATWPKGMGYLVDQLKRAMASIVLNMAEGNYRRGAVERRRFFEIARASAAEVAACVDLAMAFDLISSANGTHMKAETDAISRMLYSLMISHRSGFK